MGVALIMSMWGGFKRRTYGVLGGWLWSGLAMAVIGLVGGLPVWVVGMALGAVVGPLMNGSNQAIWQSKVAPDIQGRVFTARRLIAWLTTPITPMNSMSSTSRYAQALVPLSLENAGWCSLRLPRNMNSANAARYVRPYQ